MCPGVPGRSRNGLLFWLDGGAEIGVESPAVLADTPEPRLLLGGELCVVDGLQMPCRAGLPEKEAAQEILLGGTDAPTTKPRRVEQFARRDAPDVDVLAVSRHPRARDWDDDPARAASTRELHIELHLDARHEQRLHVHDEIDDTADALTILRERDPAPNIELAGRDAMSRKPAHPARALVGAHEGLG